MQIVAPANKKKLVAFQGNRGAYSEAASRRFFGKDVGTLPCHSFDDVFDKVRNGDVSALPHLPRPALSLARVIPGRPRTGVPRDGVRSGLVVGQFTNDSG